MLTLFRDLVRSKVALVIIGLLILSLALFGVPDLVGTFTNGSLGSSLMRADSRRLEADEVDRYADNYVSQNRQQGGEATKQSMAESGELNSLINSVSDLRIRNAYIDKLNIGSARQEAADWIRDRELMRNEVTGEFDRQAYLRFISQQGYDRERDFETALTDDLSYEQVRLGLTSALQPPDGMIDLWTIFQSEARNIAFFTFGLDDLPEAVERPSDDEVTAFYEERKDALQEPERRQFSVIAVTPDDFLHQITLTDDEVRNEYEAQIQRFSGPSTRTYDLLTFSTREEAEAALIPLLTGEAPSTTNGLLSEGLTIKSDAQGGALADAVLAAPYDLWDGVAQTSNGRFALYKVTNQEAGERRPFEEVEDSIREELTASRAERLYSRVYDEIDNAVGAGFTLEEMADSIGTPVYTFPPVDQRGFTKDGTRVRNLAVLEDALNYGFQLYPDETSDRRDGSDTQYVIRLDRIVEPDVPALDDIREDLTQALFMRAREDAVSEYAEQAIQRIESGSATITTEAQALGLDVVRPPMAISRMQGQSQGLSQTALAQIFNADLDEPFTAPLQGGMFIGVVEDIQIPDASSLAALRSTSEAELRPLIEDNIERGFAELASENVKVEFNTNMIESYIDQYKVQE